MPSAMMRSRAPVPTTWYAMCTSPLCAYFVSGSVRRVSRTSLGRASHVWIAAARHAPSRLVERDQLAGDLAALQGREAVVDLLERQRGADQLVELEFSGQIPLDVLRHVDTESVRSHVRALDSLLHEELEPVDLDALAERNHPDHRGGTALAQHVERLGRGRRQTYGLEGMIDATAGERQHGADGVAGRRVHDISRAEHPRQVALGRDGVDGDDATRACDRGTLNRIQPDATAADHRYDVTSTDLRSGQDR